ncbi:MAG: DNA repair protein RadA, partial [Candidatus Blackburnbacteria bacterium]|nr:DNA repair protein RadA [Candidatus Blackburnbacteria bacterium]
MANRTSNFVCQQCGYSQVGWAGRCPNCGSWGSLVETIEAINKRKVKSEKHKEL